MNHAHDKDWLRDLLSRDILAHHEFVVDGVPVERPTAHRGADVRRHWQRRVLPDLIPDSPFADAPEKIPFRLLDHFTEARRTEVTVDDILEGEFEPLRPLFVRSTQGSSSFPLAFHVLPVKGATRKISSRAFTERTVLLLCRKSNGELDEKLVLEFVHRFRFALEETDVSQRFLLSSLAPDWGPNDYAPVDLDPNNVVTPFAPDACGLFRSGINTLLSIDVPPGEFFELTNSFLSLHLGLYLLRIAYRLNASIACLSLAFEDAQAVDIVQLQRHERGESPETSFEGRLTLRVSSGAGRRVSMSELSRLSYQDATRELTQLHFSLLLLHRVRELTFAYLRHRMGVKDEGTLLEMAQFPSQIVQRMRNDPDFLPYLRRSTTALCVAFGHEQLAEANRQRLFEHLDSGINPFATLKQGYELYNVQPPSSSATNMAYQQGLKVFLNLLRRSEYGIVAHRPRVGGYMELGTGLLPLILLLVVGSNAEKCPLHRFWSTLESYGLWFEPADRELLLDHLRAMGLFERFSDAGSANYVRSLIVPSRPRPQISAAKPPQQAIPSGASDDLNTERPTPVHTKVAPQEEIDENAGDEASPPMQPSSVPTPPAPALPSEVPDLPPRVEPAPPSIPETFAPTIDGEHEPDEENDVDPEAAKIAALIQRHSGDVSLAVWRYSQNDPNQYDKLVSQLHKSPEGLALADSVGLQPLSIALSPGDPATYLGIPGWLNGPLAEWGISTIADLAQFGSSRTLRSLAFKGNAAADLSRLMARAADIVREAKAKSGAGSPGQAPQPVPSTESSGAYRPVPTGIPDEGLMPSSLASCPPLLKLQSIIDAQASTRWEVRRDACVAKLSGAGWTVRPEQLVSHEKHLSGAALMAVCALLGADCSYANRKTLLERALSALGPSAHGSECDVPALQPAADDIGLHGQALQTRCGAFRAAVTSELSKLAAMKAERVLELGEGLSPADVREQLTRLQWDGFLWLLPIGFIVSQADEVRAFETLAGSMPKIHPPSRDELLTEAPGALLFLAKYLLRQGEHTETASTILRALARRLDVSPSLRRAMADIVVPEQDIRPALRSTSR